MNLIVGLIILLNLLVSGWVLQQRSLKGKSRFLILVGIWIFPLIGAGLALVKLTVKGNVDPKIKSAKGEASSAQDGFRNAPKFLTEMKKKSRK